VSNNFAEIVVCDFEYEAAPGDLPNVLCMVAYVLDENLQHTRTVRLWRGEFGRSPPFDTGPDALFVAYSAWAEMTCFMVLGWKFPEHIFDQHTAYLAASNILLPHNPDEKRKKEHKRLSDACRSYGVDGWERIDKEAIAKDIGEGRWRQRGREAVLAYCEEDVRASAQLFRRQLYATDIARVLWWSNYSAKCIALIQARGMPIDVPLWNLVQENKAAVITELLRQLDPSSSSEDPIYNAAGEWSSHRFERWLINTGVAAWPRLDSGRLDLDGDAFRLMYHVPGIEGLHALRDSLRVIQTAKLPIGRDGRNRPSLFPFGTATGRNAHCRSLYNSHAGMRGFMLFPPDKIGVYLDWRTQEVGVAASLSGDQALIDSYKSGDVYHVLALDSGLTKDTDRKRWKDHNPTQRQRMKALQLGVNYGMGVQSLAKGLNQHPLIASNLIERHRRKHWRFWHWRDDQVQIAMLDRRIESVFGWPLHISHSPNKRTLYNFPMQSGGAEMLRLAAMRLCDAGVVPIMLVHDGILFEMDTEEQVAQAIEIMRGAGSDVCNGLDVGVDIDQPAGGVLVRGLRYEDKRPVAKKMWAIIEDLLISIGALSKKDAA
jgi:DNA polymerase I